LWPWWLLLLVVEHATTGLTFDVVACHTYGGAMVPEEATHNTTTKWRW
jgi:hypothetical protein